MLVQSWGSQVDRRGGTKFALLSSGEELGPQSAALPFGAVAGVPEGRLVLQPHQKSLPWRGHAATHLERRFKNSARMRWIRACSPRS